MPSLLLLLVLGGSVINPSFGQTFNNDEIPLEDIRIKARSLQEKDEVSYTPHNIVIEHPASDVDLGETLAKLPGALVRNVSGFGSATTLITSEALSSAGTAVSVDDIPVLEPTGTGVNFSLFPTTLIGSVEHHSPFYPALDPTAESLPNPGGRINLRTLGPARPGERSWQTSLLLGTANTIEGTAGYRQGDKNAYAVIGATAFNTEGNYHYKDPTSGSSATRVNNDAAGGGALAKYERKVGSTGDLELLELFSNTDRTDPGALDFPSRDHERDTFNLLGVRYNDPEVFTPHDGFFSKLSGTYSRIGVWGSGFTTDERVNSGYAQAGYGHHGEWGRNVKNTITAALDDQYNHLRDDTGQFDRNVVGIVSTLNVDWDTQSAGHLRLVPLVRQEVATSYPNATDGTMSFVYSPNTSNDLSLSYGLQHVYPSISGVAGFQTNSFTLLANPNLDVQRDNLVSATYTLKLNTFTLYSTAFFDRIHNRATLVNINDSIGQIINAPDVWAWGYTLDGQLFLQERLTLRNSISVQRAWDTNTNNEMPYKPRLEDWATVSYGFLPCLWASVQERFIGKRFSTVTNDTTISPYAQTDLRLDVSVFGGTAFFKVANLFDAAAFEFPGFPVPGRSYWAGFTL